MAALTRLARELARPAQRFALRRGQLPRRAYMHCFIEGEGVHSRIQLHNFFSFFLPDLADPITVHITLRDAAGTVLLRQQRSILGFGSLSLPVADLLPPTDAAITYGSVTVDVEPSDRQRARLLELGPVGGWVQSPFWMAFFGDDGSVAYVHSIDQHHGELAGIGRWAVPVFGARVPKGYPWTSSRIIPAAGLREIDAYLVNHSRSAGRSRVLWRWQPSGEPAFDQEVRIPARGVGRVTLAGTDLEPPGNDGRDGLSIEVRDLLTANGKPYIMVRYGNGPFSLHHG